MLASVSCSSNLRRMTGNNVPYFQNLTLFGAINHIALAGPSEAEAAPVVLRQEFEGEWPTDHYPVVVDLGG